MTTQAPLNLLSGDPQATFIEYADRSYSRGSVVAAAEAVLGLLDQAGVPADAMIGLIGRNRPLHAGALLGLISAGRAACMVHAFQSPQAMAADLAQSGFAAVIADAEDWTEPMIAAVRDTGGVGIALSLGDGACRLVPGLERLAARAWPRREGDVVVEILSSGTTGKPKRIPMSSKILNRALDMSSAAGLSDKREFDITTWPMSSIGGVCRLIANAALDRPLVYFDKFTVAPWVEAVRRHRPRVITGMPAMAQMILDAGVDPDHLACVEVFYGGSAPFDPALKVRFEAAYGLKVIWAYGATEFYGTVVSWTEALDAEWGGAKLGSSGRALPGVSLRVVDPDTGAVLAPGELGLLQARVEALGPDWIATNDLAQVDADGFFFHRGRQDGAIVRGGFKVLPETIRAALCQHPAVLDASAVGLPDSRLGEVPVAAVELRRGATAPDPAELIAFLRQRLSSQMIPTRLIVIGQLPRTASLKVEIPAVRRLFSQDDPGQSAPI